MAALTLTDVKNALRVIHSGDDAELTRLLAAATDEAEQYLAVSELPDSAACNQAIILLIRADYEATKPEDIDTYREAARHKLHPYRQGLGL